MSEVRKEENRYDITIEEIAKLLQDYQIGKKPLAKLLGWGETTILRYLGGETPTKEYAEKLNRLKQDPKLYYTLLLANYENITEVAFRKSKKAVLLKLYEKKIMLLAQYLINLVDGETSPVRICVILFYAQAVSLVFFKKSLFPEEFRLSNNKIPYEGIYHYFYQQGCRSTEIPKGILSEQQEILLKIMNSATEWYGTKALRLLFEFDRIALQKEPIKNKIVSKSQMQRYFQRIFEQIPCTNIDGFPLFFKKRITSIF